MMRGSLAELEAVLAVSSRGGFRAAARELGISSSSLSQQIAALEARMGVRLFNRSTRSVVLSAAGEQFVASVGPALEAIRNAVEHVDEHRAEATGTLRINTSVGATRMILTPLILEYMRRNPQMAVEIVTEGALVDVNAKGFDAGIRIREAVPPDMVVVPIGDSVRPAIVGSVEYFPAWEAAGPSRYSEPRVHPCPHGERHTLSLGVRKARRELHARRSRQAHARR